MPWYTSIVVQCPGPPNFSSLLGPGLLPGPTYMPSARAETQPAAMGTAVRAWRLNTASRLQPGDRKNDVSSCLLNPELRQVARNRESSERAALFIGRRG